jgi:dipeptidyl aminopeptidase/acylaminoacyl peptidase
MRVTRRLALSGLAASAAFGAGAANAQPERRTASGLRINATDYAQARAAFTTRLLYRGPSPQPFDNESPPQGVREITYASGSLALKAWFARPPGDALVPGVVFAHGGFAYGAEDFEMARPYLDAGFAVITPMLRGENGMPGEYSMFYGEVDDVIAAGAYLRAQANIDQTRIFLAGHSVGGTLSMLAAQASPIFRASASFSGSPDQITFCAEYSQIVPFDPNNPLEYEMRSPLSYASSFKAPARIYCAAREVFVPDAQETARIARAARLDVQAEEVRGDHFTAVPEAMRRSIAFFGQHT